MYQIQEGEWTCGCGSVYMIFVLDFGAVPTIFYLFVFPFHFVTYIYNFPREDVDDSKRCSMHKIC